MIFKIKKGTHTSFRFPKLTFKSSISAKITLIGDFSYVSDSPENQKDTNKIIGLSDGWHHHKDSIRIGYRYVNNKIEIMSYRYNNGEHYTSLMGYVNENEEFDVKIEISDKYYVIFKNVKFQYPRTSKWWFIRYWLFPYFGGQEVTKKDLQFKIKFIFLK